MAPVKPGVYGHASTSYAGRVCTLPYRMLAGESISMLSGFSDRAKQARQPPCARVATAMAEHRESRQDRAWGVEGGWNDALRNGQVAAEP